MLFFNQETLNKLAENLNYSDANRFILNCNEDSSFKKTYPDIWNRIYKNYHCRDVRDCLGYAKNLIKNWIFEELVVYGLKNVDVDIHLNGAESDRSFLMAGTITQAPDTRIENLKLPNDQYISIDMELIKSSGKFWEKDGSINQFRDNKVQNLIKDKALCFCCEDVGNGELKYTIIDFAKEDLVVYSERPNEKLGGKMCSPIPLALNDIEFKELNFMDMSNVKEEIINILSERF